MENNKNDDYNSLSDMLSKNRAEKRASVSENKGSVDDILNSLKKDSEAGYEKGLKAYNPAAEIASQTNDEAATIMVSGRTAEKKSANSSGSSKENRTKDIKRRESRRKAEEQRQHRRTFGHIFGAVLISITIIFISSYLGIFLLNTALDFTGIATNEFEVQIEIPENSTTAEIAVILEKNGLITMPKLFEIYSQISKADGKYTGGTFELTSSMSYSTLIKTLQAAKNERKTVEIRIVEGMTAHEIAELLEENCVCRVKDFEQFYMKKMNLYSFEKRVLQNSLKFSQLEGYLFPDTYEFYQVNELVENPKADIDTTKYAETVAEKIYSNFNSKITKAMYKKMNEMGLTLDELITLASMVQKESGTVEDMGNIASVFLNRLNNADSFPNLQSDVTIFYVEENIKPYYDEKTASRDYQTIADAYNTYVAKGIPAGPVCNPGLDAINAVLDAPSTDYFYFCANPDTLETFYAKTQEEHEANLVLAGVTATQTTSEG